MRNSIVELQAGDEASCDASRQETALIVNPRASVAALIDAARARMMRIERITAPYLSFDLGAMNPGELVDVILVIQALNDEARTLAEAAMERAGAFISVADEGAPC